MSRENATPCGSYVRRLRRRSPDSEDLPSVGREGTRAFRTLNAIATVWDTQTRSAPTKLRNRGRTARTLAARKRNAYVRRLRRRDVVHFVQNYYDGCPCGRGYFVAPDAFRRSNNLCLPAK